MYDKIHYYSVIQFDGKFEEVSHTRFIICKPWWTVWECPEALELWTHVVYDLRLEVSLKFILHNSFSSSIFLLLFPLLFSLLLLISMLQLSSVWYIPVVLIKEKQLYLLQQKLVLVFNGSR